MPQEFFKHPLGGFPFHGSDRGGEWNLLGANFNAHLGVAAIFKPPVPHDGIEAFVGVEFARGMAVKKTNLRNRSGPNEVRLLIVLRAGFKAATTGHAS